MSESYTIQIKNTYKQDISYEKSGISPSAEQIPSTSIDEYISDNERYDGGFLSVPLYNRVQYVNLPPNSILIMETNNSAEAAYYSSLRLGSGNIKVSPSPVDGGGGDTGDLARRLLERDFENSKITIPANIKLGNYCLAIDPNLYQIEFESDESFIDDNPYYDIYYTTVGDFDIYRCTGGIVEKLYETYPNAVRVYCYQSDKEIKCIFYNVYVNDAMNISKWIISEDRTPFQDVRFTNSDTYEICPIFLCKDGYSMKEAYAQILNIDPENMGEMIFRPITLSKYLLPDYMFQINEPIEDPIKTCIFYNVDKETGEIKSNITSDIEYTQGESYVSLYSSVIEPSRGSSKGSIKDINELIKSLFGEKDTKEETKDNEKSSSNSLKSDSKSEESTLYKFDDGSNFTEISTEDDLQDYAQDPDTNQKVFTKTNITDGSGNTLYITTKLFPSIYKSLPYVDFKEGKYWLYIGE